MKSIDENYLAKFAARELGPEHFDHRGHLWMAWQHLACYEVQEFLRSLGLSAPEIERIRNQSRTCTQSAQL
jgi:hypothetical protein